MKNDIYDLLNDIDNQIDTFETVDITSIDLKNKDTITYKKGKNYYCETDNLIITINSYSYTIITAHTKK